jgi:predicted adenylyl cyclase CyaB
VKHLNVEIKGRCRDAKRIRDELTRRRADHRGRDHQVDTYFRCPRGRLKLRRGDIETALIHYDRPGETGPKPARVTLLEPADPDAVKRVLSAALGVRCVVDKRRDIYFLDNVKVHLDVVEELGEFVEIEAIDTAGRGDADALRRQCEELLSAFGIAAADLLAGSYADMLPVRE